jgi:hypothetical protein
MCWFCAALVFCHCAVHRLRPQTVRVCDNLVINVGAAPPNPPQPRKSEPAIMPSGSTRNGSKGTAIWTGHWGGRGQEVTGERVAGLLGQKALYAELRA